jgi:hypothetical protein
MHDFVALVEWRLFGHGRISVRHHEDDFAAQALFVIPKGCLTLAVE